MKSLNILVLSALIVAAPAMAAITVIPPSLSPSLNEYDGGKVVDENSNRMGALGVVLLDSNGHSGVSSSDLQAGKVSQVTGREGLPEYKLANGQKIPLVGLVGINTSSKTVIPFDPLAKLAAVSCSAGAGGAATEALTCIGLVSTDTVLAVSQKTVGANGLALVGWSSLVANGITGVWHADPGAGSVVMVLVKHQ